MKSPVVSGCCTSRRAAAETIDLRAAERVRTEADLIRVVENGRGDSAYTETFLALLDERHPVYRGVSTSVVSRMRGALLLALGHRALPTAALPFVLEELESAHEAWLTAVAAHVLRKYPQPSSSFASPLLSAILYIRHRDDVVRLANYAGHGPGGETTTAMAEVMQTIAWLGRGGLACLPGLEDLLAKNPGPATSAMATAAMKSIRDDDRGTVAECACGAARSPAIHSASNDISTLRLQDHSGAELSFAEIFHGRPSIVTFFYTRCDNPTKCPLTMYKFGCLQRLLQEDGLGDSIGTAAITYDPDYDRPERLLQFAQSWGAKPSPLHRILRTVGEFATLRDYFALGVNLGASGIVNRHRLEVFVLDDHGRIAHVVARRRWDEKEIVRLASAMLRAPAARS